MLQPIKEFVSYSTVPSRTTDRWGSTCHASRPWLRSVWPSSFSPCLGSRWGSWISMGAGDGKRKTQEITGWWFGTWILFFHILGIVTPTDYHIFQRGRRTNHQPVRLIPGMGTSRNRYVGIWMSKFTIHNIWEYLEKCMVIKTGIKKLMACAICSDFHDMLRPKTSAEVFRSDRV